MLWYGGKKSWRTKFEVHEVFRSICEVFGSCYEVFWSSQWSSPRNVKIFSSPSLLYIVHYTYVHMSIGVWLYYIYMYSIGVWLYYICLCVVPSKKEWRSVENLLHSKGRVLPALPAVYQRSYSLHGNLSLTGNYRCLCIPLLYKFSYVLYMQYTLSQLSIRTYIRSYCMTNYNSRLMQGCIEGPLDFGNPLNCFGTLIPLPP